MKKNKIFILMTAGIVFAFSACTDLEVENLDSLKSETDDGAFSGITPATGLTTAYSDLRAFGAENNLNAMLEVSSDEVVVPTRGTDWGDNGQWRTLHTHLWDASHPFVIGTWNILNSNVYRLNQLLAPESEANAVQLAEGKFLRAYNMYFILDLYGKFPFRGVNEGVDVNPKVYEGQEAFDFILNDLNEALPDLESIPPSDQTIRASKAAAHFLLAKMYLNKHIFTRSGTAEAADMTKVIEHVDAIKAEGFELQEGYFNIFTNEVDTETIFWTNASVGNRIFNGLHYSFATPDSPGGGWNGFSTTADFYALFEGPDDTNAPGAGQEERRGFVPTDSYGYGFLVGPQYGSDGPLLTRAGQPLVFTKEFPGLLGNNEAHGIRILKYHPDNGDYTEHLILFRYADAHLMKIEAILRGGNSSENALTLYNELRTIRHASTVSGVELMDVLDERGRELYIEGWRRNDQIRFGTFTSTWPMKENTEEFRVLYPIPAVAIASNPNLEQNPGY